MINETNLVRCGHCGELGFPSYYAGILPDGDRISLITKCANLLPGRDAKELTVRVNYTSDYQDYV